MRLSLELVVLLKPLGRQAASFGPIADPVVELGLATVKVRPADSRLSLAVGRDERHFRCRGLRIDLLRSVIYVTAQRFEEW